MKYVVLLSLFLCPLVHASPTPAQVSAAVDPAFKVRATYAVAIAAAVADIATTIAGEHRGCNEANPIYGTHPSTAALVAGHAIPLGLMWRFGGSDRDRMIEAGVIPAAWGFAAAHNAGVRCVR